MVSVQQSSGRTIPAVVTRILSGRGISLDQHEAFLYPEYDRDLHDPFMLLDMDLAVARIMLAAERGERVVVYGDYDIDGITASAVMLEVLRAHNIEAESYIPNRFEEGYGINQGALEHLKQAGAGLVISVDCGITSVAEAAWAREHGLDLIITDHHSVPAVIPEAIAVINPKRPGDPYPFKDLAGVGVAFKLACALQQRSGLPGAGQEKWLLDLVALGTVCDVVPLVGENRALVSYGLVVLRRTRRIGPRELCAVGGVDISQIRAQHLGFVLGPRMNAAGRLEHAARSLDLMLTDNVELAGRIAEELEVLNRQRRADQDRIFAEADALATAYADDPVLVLSGADWSHGVVGIVASKLVEKWQKPVLVAQNLGDHTKGSARSVPGFDMVAALRANAELLTKFGGHFFAAGYTLPSDQIEALRAGMCEHYLGLDQATLEQDEAAPAEVVLDGLEAVDWPLLHELEHLEPFGAGNPEPVFELKGLTLAQRRVMGQTGKHLRLALRDDSGRQLSGVGFGLVARYPDLAEGQRLRVFGRLQKNEYQGRATLQLVITAITNE